MERSFNPGGDLVIVTARLIGPQPTGTSLQLALDTGAERTLIRPAILRAAGYDLSQPIGHGRMRSASGSVRVPIIWVAAIRSCGVEQHALRVIAQDLPTGAQYDGLLGLDFIRPGPLHIDFLRGTVRIGPRRWWPFGR